MTATATVIIVNYEAGDHLARCLLCLARQVSVEFNVIVVDNGSKDGSCEKAFRAIQGDPRFERIDPGGNIGFAAGNNLAASRTDSEFIVTLNPDAFPREDWLKALLDAADRYPNAAMFGSTQIMAEESSLLDGIGDNYLFLGLPWRGGHGAVVPPTLREVEVFSPCAAAALFRRRAFAAVGGFDERFFCYVEDVDLGFRLRLNGSFAIQVPDAVVEHVGGGSSGAISGFAKYHGTRNTVWCFFKNMPLALLLWLAPLHLVAVLIVAVVALVRGDGAMALKGFARAVRELPWADRRRVQAHRVAPVRRIVRALAWNPLLFLGRGQAPLRATKVPTSARAA